MRVYVRKIFPHDTTHEVSVRTDIVNDFFGGNTKFICFVGKKSKSKACVNINSATDPRFGGDFKKLLIDEGTANINDILIIRKLDSEYELEIIKPSNSLYFDLMVLFRGNNRHIVTSTEEISILS